ncbi:MAG: transposase [Candidatus Njordarchaeia archaeon]
MGHLLDDLLGSSDKKVNHTKIQIPTKERLQELMKFTDEEIIKLIRAQRFGKDLSNLKCPYCGSSDIIKFGHLNRACHINRYRCKSCGKTFNDLTNTPLAKSKLTPKEHILIVFLHFRMLLSIKDIAKYLKKPYKTVWKVIVKWERYITKRGK